MVALCCHGLTCPSNTARRQDVKTSKKPAAPVARKQTPAKAPKTAVPAKKAASVKVPVKAKTPVKKAVKPVAKPKAKVVAKPAVKAKAPVKARWNGPSALVHVDMVDLGRCPRLGWRRAVGPLGGAFGARGIDRLPHRAASASRAQLPWPQPATGRQTLLPG